MTRTTSSISGDIENIVEEIRAVFKSSNIQKQTDQFASAIKRARRIYIAGVGRSGLVVKMFGQRLMHLGFKVHLADEITAPGISKRDLLIACSGTGRTVLTLYMAEKAYQIGAHMVVITANRSSELATKADTLVVIPAALRRGAGSTQPARSLFEQAMLIYLDAVVISLKKKLRVTDRQMQKRHSNLE